MTLQSEIEAIRKRRVSQLVDLDIEEISAVSQPANMRKFLIIKDGAPKRRVNILRNLRIDFASLVDAPANQFTKDGKTDGAFVCLLKRDGEIRKDMEMENETVRDVAWSKIAKMGAALRDTNPKLTPEGARVEAMKTPEGRECLKLYRHPDSHLTVKAFQELQSDKADRLEKLGAEDWAGVVSKLARSFAAEDPGAGSIESKIVKGYDKIRSDYPGVWKAYEAERNERMMRAAGH